MMLGMSLATFTLVHVIISLIGIFSGFIVLSGLLSAKRLNGLTALFLLTTVLTSVTGFGFPFDHLLPSHKVGIISLVVLAIAIPARYSFHMAGKWRWIYVVTAMIALYLNVFVLVVQSFEKVPALTRHGSHPIGAAIPGRAVGGAGVVYCAHHFCGEEIPSRGRPHALTGGFPGRCSRVTSMRLAPHIARFAMCGFSGTTGMRRDHNQRPLLGALNDCPRSIDSWAR